MSSHSVPRVIAHIGDASRCRLPAAWLVKSQSFAIETVSVGVAGRLLGDVSEPTGMDEADPVHVESFPQRWPIVAARR